MGLLHIMERGGDKAKRFEEAMYDIEDAISEACDIYEEMKEQFSERSGSSYRMSRRAQEPDGSMPERRSRRH